MEDRLEAGLELLLQEDVSLQELPEEVSDLLSPGGRPFQDPVDQMLDEELHRAHAEVGAH